MEKEALVVIFDELVHRTLGIRSGQTLVPTHSKGFPHLKTLVVTKTWVSYENDGRKGAADACCSQNAK